MNLEQSLANALNKPLASCTLGERVMLASMGARTIEAIRTCLPRKGDMVALADYMTHLSKDANRDMQSSYQQVRREALKASASWTLAVKAGVYSVVDCKATRKRKGSKQPTPAELVLAHVLNVCKLDADADADAIIAAIDARIAPARVPRAPARVQRVRKAA